MEEPTQCPVTLTTRVLGGKWKPRIVWALIRFERLRYSEIRKACPPISDRILSKELKELEAWGLIDRHDFLVVPPKTEYTLTSLGHTLRPVIAAMADWGTTQRERIAARVDGAERELREPSDL
jgi:DNA-binding HxlR family transcriptional regulator